MTLLDLVLRRLACRRSIAMDMGPGYATWDILSSGTWRVASPDSVRATRVSPGANDVRSETSTS